MKFINSDVSNRISFGKSIKNLCDFLKILDKKDDNLKLVEIIGYLEVLSDLPIFDPIHSKLALKLYDKLYFTSFNVGKICSKYSLANGLSEYNELVNNYFVCLLKAAPKYKVSASQYFKLVVDGKFNKKQHSIYYSDLFILRITETFEIIILPFHKLLKIHLGLNDIKSLGEIKITDNNPGEIHFERSYVQFRGVGKDDREIIQNLSLCVDTFQIKIL